MTNKLMSCSEELCNIKALIAAEEIIERLIAENEELTARDEAQQSEITKLRTRMRELTEYRVDFARQISVPRADTCVCRTLSGACEEGRTQELIDLRLPVVRRTNLRTVIASRTGGKSDQAMAPPGENADAARMSELKEQADHIPYFTRANIEALIASDSADKKTLRLQGRNLRTDPYPRPLRLILGTT